MHRARPLRPRDVGLLVLVAGVWGCNFLVIRWGLASMPPLLFTALRFLLCALPWIFVVPRPRVGNFDLVRLGLVLGACVFGFLFLGMAAGVPPGLASLLMQAQVFFTAGLSRLLLAERLDGTRWLAIGLGAAGIALAASQQPAHGSAVGFGLVLAGALAWGFANVLLKRLPRVDMLGVMVWISLVPPLPLLALAAAQAGPAALASTVLHMGWRGWVAVLYTALLSTIVGYGVWGAMLQRHATATVAQFSLLVPVFGLVSARLVYGERHDAAEIVGMGLVLVSLMLANAASLITALRRSPASTVGRPAPLAFPSCRGVGGAPIPASRDGTAGEGLRRAEVVPADPHPSPLSTRERRTAGVASRRET